jgi:prepilin-type N-terminal cleavage/methylation domain-containing protein
VSRLTRLRGDESGFTLVELLIAMVVMGIIVVGLLPALALGIRSGDDQRTLSTAELTLRSLAEHVKAAPYEPCALPADYQAGWADPPDEEGITATVVEVAFWDQDLTGPAVVFQATCLGDPEGSRLQQVLVRVDVADTGSVHQTLVVKRGD